MFRRPCLRHSIAVAYLLPTALVATAHADEGMWLPEQLPLVAEQLTRLGLALPVQTLASLDNGPLAAVVSLGGCSASFVSAHGLVVTNHHCAEGALSINSTPENNVLANGFHARTQAAEVWAGPGSRIYVTTQMDDVTAEVDAALLAASDDRARYDALDQVRKSLIAACEEPGGTRCSLASYHNGLSWRLIHQMEIEDVRLVYAPPSAIGFYGGDEDNWMWPRHTGDFTFFRAWVGPDGRPAPHSADNVPYRPAAHLALSVEGVDPGDFVMVAGYPGSTYRYRTASEMAWAEADEYPWQIGTMDEVLAILDARIEADADAAVRLSSLRFGMSNYHKNNQGMLDGFTSSGAVARSQQREARLRAEAPSPEVRAALDELESVLAVERQVAQADELLGWMAWTVRLLGVARTTYRLSIERQKPDDLTREAGFQERDWPRIAERLARVERSYDAAVDEQLMAYWLRRADALPEAGRIDAFDALIDRFRDQVDPYAAAARHLYGETRLTSVSERTTLLEARPEDFTAARDPLLQLAAALYPQAMQREEQNKTFSGARLRLRPAWMRALQAVEQRPLYPDANGTLRVTFGTVRGYPGADAVWYEPQTTLRGLQQKERGEDPFASPREVLDAISTGNFGRWLDSRLGSVPVNFLSTLDTTGGNSGSVTLDAHGRLVGLLFDGNYESMASDWLFDPVRTRSIHVDVRYMGWLLEHVYEATELLDELGIAAAN